MDGGGGTQGPADAEGAVPPPEGAVPPPEGAVPPPEGAVPPPEGAVPPPEGAVPPPEGAVAPPPLLPQGGGGGRQLGGRAVVVRTAFASTAPGGAPCLDRSLIDINTSRSGLRPATRSKTPGVLLGVPVVRGAFVPAAALGRA